MTKDSPVCWMLMPQFLNRVREFSQEFTVTGSDNAAQWFEACFGSGDQRMLGIGIIESESDGSKVPSLIGHVLVGCESYLGSPHGIVYQFAKDKGKNYRGDRDEDHPFIVIRHMIDYWARGHNIDQVYALVDGAARAKLFGWFGFDDKMRIVRMNVSMDTGIGG